MTVPDYRTTKLDWVRDGMKWVVGLAAGLLAVSATYYYDRFDQDPKWKLLLWGAWFFLGGAALAGILAAQAAWKNVGETGKFGPWLNGSYFAAMWGFLIGFGLLAVFMIANVGVRRTEERTVADLFLVTEPFPPFTPASWVASDPRIVVAACNARLQLADSGSRAAFVVGRFDRRELTTRAQQHTVNNLELAQRRADRVRAFLTDSALCKAAPLNNVVAFVGGPRLELPAPGTTTNLDSALAGDRTVEIYGFQRARR